MSLIISSNSIAQLANLNLKRTYSNLQTNIERLSTGLRINNASDSPVGLSFSQKLRSELAGISQGISNINEGISLLQTAASGLSIIDEKLLRMKELAEQGSTGTYTSNERYEMQSEFELMASEIDRIANSSEYNDIKLLNGNLSSSSLYTNAGGWKEPNSGVLIHFGSGNKRSEAYYYISIEDSRTTNLFKDISIAISTSTAAQTALSVINTAIMTKDNTSAFVGALQNRLGSTLDLFEDEYAVKNQAYSRITNLDIAEEMTDYIKNLVLSKSAVAILGQANILPQMALALLD